ncbi:MAG: hypothetical protein WBE58_08730 [Verrucomicrobiales bacterium]
MNLAPLEGLLPRWHSLPFWKRKILSLSALLGLAGVGASNYQALLEEPGSVPQEAAYSHPERNNWNDSIAPAQPSVASLQQRTAPGHTWTGAVGRLGAGFGLAMIFGILLRWFIKTVISVTCVIGVLVALLVHYGIIEPFWSPDSDFTATATEWVTHQTESLTTFVKGFLPTTAVSGAGLFLGFRR